MSDDVKSGKSVRELQEELEECHENLIKAGEFGKMLLENNEDLKTDMDELRKSYDRKLELAEQERYAIQLKLEQKTSMEAWYSEELSHLKQQLADGYEDLKESMESEKQQEVSKLTRQIEELRLDLDQAGLNEGQLKQKAAELEDLLQEKMNKTELSFNRSLDTPEEIHVLQEEIATLENEITSLKSQLIEKRSEVHSALTEVEGLKGKLVARDEELEHERCQFTSINNMLEQARMEKMDLKCQLDALRMETSSHRKKGNSIFSELDDRRIDAEKQLISLRNAHSTIQEKYAVEKQQNNKYKMQISRLLLQMSSGRVDSEYVAELENKLAHANQEIKGLLEEKSQNTQSTEVQIATVLDHVKDKSDYKQYLLTVVEGKTQELQRAKQELHSKNLQLLDEKSRTVSLNTRIIQLEAERDKMKSQSMKVATKLEEMRQKYEPESVKKSGVLVVKRTETIPSDANVTETSMLLSNSTMDQSQTSFLLKEKKKPLQPLVENNKTEISTEKTTLSKCLKKKTVSVSGHVEEYEIQNDAVSDIDNVPPPKAKHKGRSITAVKHISTENTRPASKDECKTQ